MRRLRGGAERRERERASDATEHPEGRPSAPDGERLVDQPRRVCRLRNGQRARVARGHLQRRRALLRNPPRVDPRAQGAAEDPRVRSRKRGRLRVARCRRERPAGTAARRRLVRLLRRSQLRILPAPLPAGRVPWHDGLGRLHPAVPGGAAGRPRGLRRGAGAGRHRRHDAPDRQGFCARRPRPVRPARRGGDRPRDRPPRGRKRRRHEVAGAGPPEGPRLGPGAREEAEAQKRSSTLWASPPSTTSSCSSI